MPRMDGLTLAREVKARADLPIIVLSAIDAGDNKADLLDEFAEDYITKPYHYSELRARIQRVLRRVGERVPRKGLDLGPDLVLELHRRQAIGRGEPVQTDASNAGGDCASGGHADCIWQKLVSSILPGSMPAFSAANLNTAQVCYVGYQDPNPDTPTYSIELEITVSYRFPLSIPMIGNILDGIDGSSDGALSIGTTSTSRVENASFATSNPIPVAICRS